MRTKTTYQMLYLALAEGLKHSSLLAYNIPQMSGKYQGILCWQGRGGKGRAREDPFGP